MSTSGTPAFSVHRRFRYTGVCTATAGLSSARSWSCEARLLVECNVVAYRRGWIFLVSGFFEPLLYLLSIGLGLNHLVGRLAIGGRSISCTDYVAPGLLASSAMNGAIFDATFGIFFKLKIAETYDAVLATPLGVRDAACGNLSWAFLCGTVYSIAFLTVITALGLVTSWRAVFCLSAAMLVSLAFVAWERSELSRGAIERTSIWPRSLSSRCSCSRACFPRCRCTRAGFASLSMATPLYQGVALLRGLDTGVLGPVLLVHAFYLRRLGGISLIGAFRRLGRLVLA
jgi:lipooligosaccharide transport system permease protein